MEQLQNNKSSISLVLPAIILAAGIALAGSYISDSLIKARTRERYVTVKGLAEREVKADLAIWPIIIKSTGNDLIETNAKIENDRNIVIDFLVERGFKKEEIEIGNLVVIDLLSQPYRNSSSENFRFIINAVVTLKTKNIDLVKETTQFQSILVQKGVIIGSDSYNSGDYNGPIYEFTNFSDIKPIMLEEAIKNARSSAVKFAGDSGSTLGLLKKANQGTFSISATEGIESADEYSNTRAAKRSINKKIRVVTTLEYYLRD